MDFREFLANNVVRLDGGMGTLLQAEGLLPGELPERWCLTHPDKVRAIHRAYFEAGSHVVATNTFGANLLKYDEAELDAIIGAAVACARAATKMKARGITGCQTIFDVAPADLSAISREDMLAHML